MKKIIQRVLIIGVIIIGIYMLATNTWPASPAISGLGFLMAGLAMWVPHCPICKMLFKD